LQLRNYNFKVRFENNKKKYRSIVCAIGTKLDARVARGHIPYSYAYVKWDAESRRRLTEASVRKLRSTTQAHEISEEEEERGTGDS
jgi:hypothetical protein